MVDNQLLGASSTCQLNSTARLRIRRAGAHRQCRGWVIGNSSGSNVKACGGGGTHSGLWLEEAKFRSAGCFGGRDVYLMLNSRAESASVKTPTVYEISLTIDLQPELRIVSGHAVQRAGVVAANSLSSADPDHRHNPDERARSSA
jgi:hypothetical protein